MRRVIDVETLRQEFNAIQEASKNKKKNKVEFERFVQTLLFEAGYRWPSTGTEYNKDVNLKFILLNKEDKNILYSHIMCNEVSQSLPLTLQNLVSLPKQYINIRMLQCDHSALQSHHKTRKMASNWTIL